MTLRMALFFESLLEIRNKAVDAACAGANGFQLLRCTSNEGDEFVDLFIALASGAGDGDDGRDQSHWVHRVQEESPY